MTKYPKYRIGDVLLLKYVSIGKFKITGVYIGKNGEILYTYKNWIGMGNYESESDLEKRIVYPHHIP